MARTPRSSGSSRSSRSSGSSSRRTSKRPRTEEREERESLFGIPLIKFGDITPLIEGPFAFALQATPWGPTKTAGNVLGALASSPYYTARYPKASMGDAWETVRGIYELPPALKRSVNEVGWGETGKMMLAGMAEDYKRRYGKNWREEAKKDPFFNFLDAVAVLGVGTRAIGLAGASTSLRGAGIARTALEFKKPRLLSPLPVRGGTVWQESSRPGLLSKGVADTRKIVAPSGDVTEQSLSRSPLRRSFQELSDMAAMQFPNLPMMGATTRVARGKSRQLTRETERLMGSVSDPHAVEALPEALRTRLYWGSQIGDHSKAALKEFRDLLSDALEKGELPDDPEFRSVVMEARRRGFGKHLISRMDAAIDAEPDARYERAIESMQDMTRVTEETYKDANGFAGHQGDLRRASDRLRGMSRRTYREARLLPEDGTGWDAFLENIPDDALRAAADDYLRPRAALRDIAEALEDMFGSRRNRVRDWRDLQRLKQIPERMARIEQMTKLWGAEKAQAVIQVWDAAARASGDAAEFYRKNIGTPDAETAAEFMARDPSDRFLQRSERLLLDQADPANPSKTGFYSQLAKEVQDKMPRQMPVRQLENMLKKGITPKDWENMGLDLYFDSFPDEAIITKEEFQRHISLPINAYNIKETIIRRSRELGGGEDDWEGEWDQPQYDEMERGMLMSRNPKGQEYFEAHYSLPPATIGRRYMKKYYGKGEEHWDETNVAAHMRGHVYEEADGSRTLLIDEAQSDWESEFRDIAGSFEKTHGEPYKFRDFTQAEWRRMGEVDDPRVADMIDQGLDIGEELEDVDAALSDLYQHYGYDLDAENKQLLMIGDYDNVIELDELVMEGKADPDLARELGFAEDVTDQEMADKLWEKMDELEAQLPDKEEFNAAFGNVMERTREVQRELGISGDMPPSPWGKNYVRSVARIIKEMADREKVDRIIIVDPRTQFLRSLDLLDMDADMNEPLWAGGFTTQKWLDARPGSTNRSWNQYIPTHPLYAESVWPRLYGSKSRNSIVNELAKELKIEGVHMEKAYKGRYGWIDRTHEGGDVFSVHGSKGKTSDMPGTVFELPKKLDVRSEGGLRLFQQTKWDELPKGAVELLKDGRRHIHLFEEADPSTAIHELAHTVLFDLPDDELATIERIYANGRSLKKGEWATGDHESFARSFEQYVRTGKAPTPELRDAFAKLAQWMLDIWNAVKRDPESKLDPEATKVFDSMLSRHRPEDVDTFIPHRAADPNLSGGRVSKGVPRATRDIGDEAISRVPLFARNKLALMGMGLLNDDPRLLIEHMNRIVMLARANQLRETVLELSQPLSPDGVRFMDGRPVSTETHYIVKKAGRGINKPLYDALEAADDPVEIRDNIANFVDDYITDDRQKWEAWRGKDQLYAVEKGYIDKLFKNVTGKTPGATTKGESSWTKAADAGLDAVRSMLLYLNPGFYTANLLGNATMMGLSDPRAARFLIPSMKQALKAAYKPDTADPLWRRIGVEMGRGPTSGGLSSRPALVGRQASRRGPVAGRVSENISLGIGEYGRRSGRVIDDAMRIAVWKQAAHKRGYTTDAKIKKLLDDGTGRDATKKAKDDLNSIRDEAEQLMLDFDSMTPFEKSWLTRVIFLYPFLKASAKWPAMFLGERPITAGVAGALAGEGSRMTTEQLGERPPLPLWMEGAARTGAGRYISAGQLSPTAPFFGLIESLMGVGGTPETGISRPIDYANPLYQLAVELAQGRSQFGQEMSAPSILRQDFPMTALQRQALQLKQPSDIYSDRDILHTFMRALRFLPYGVNEPPTPVRPPEPGESTSRRTRRG